ncbi:succinate dehydrogenase assembly factor 2 [Marinobacter sp. X15-166B]|uniref:FAD assembly factor SdhE n=1 Tax=Marinobacter sp. X15-166B TaxID=1897620 RepID=UPI00085C9EA7|nr:succinate dehydrogenase assembly factor 2 [Marinobacter sp. X15-166B]OEY66899.1 hypothetical protein BG841_10815 [Marinobacter sp. X15-166B]
MSDITQYNRLFWHSRRGMLELDLLLLPFLEEVYRDLPAEDQKRYEQLLTCEDTDMFEWFMQRSQPKDPELRRIVELIIKHAGPV